MRRRKNFKNILRKCIIDVTATKVKLPVVCGLCKSKFKSIPGLGSHLLNKHGLTIEQYVFQEFENLTPTFKFEKCEFCKVHDAKPLLKIDFIKRQYSLSYENGYQCDAIDCLDAICLEYFGKTYANAKKQYEHIGANVKYLATRYKRTEEDIKQNVKRDPNYTYSPENTASLVGFIARHGKKEGTRRYNERCEKISKSLKIEWFIEKYGLEEGTKKFQERQGKFLSASSDITHSKNQYAIFEALKQIDSSWQDERYAGGIAKVDMLNEKNNVVVEYFGDYWHCNPDTYDDDFFNKNLKCTAKEKLHKDKERLDKILAYSKSIELIIVIWEKSFNKINDVTKITDLVYNHIRKHKQGKKEIIWI